MKPYKIDITEPFEADMLGEVRAGFPSPADEEPHEKLDLVRLLVRHPASTFFFRVGGTSMVEADMDKGDIIIVDRAIEPYNGCSAVCYIDGEFTVKRVERHDDHALLIAEIVGMYFVAPALLSLLIHWGMKRLGWIKDGDLKLQR